MRAPIASKLAELRKAIERIEKTPRKGFTPKQRREVYEAAEGRCSACENALTSGFQIDHVIALALGGAHEPGNWVAICVDCHKRKSAGDVKRIAKVNRITKRETEGQPVSQIRSRGFDKTRRKRMNGTVERVS